jgi:hypothetical protein
MRFAPHSWLQAEAVDFETFASSVGAGLAALDLSRSGGRRWVEQTPSYSTVATALASMFPQAQFLHIIRDGRQVADSMRRMWGWSVTRAAREWREHVECVVRLERSQPGRVHRLHYEGLVSAPAEALERVFDFLGLSTSDAAARFVRQPPINVSPGTEREGHADKLMPRWQAWSTEEQSAWLDEAGALLAELGYD